MSYSPPKALAKCAKVCFNKRTYKLKPVPANFKDIGIRTVSLTGSSGLTVMGLGVFGQSKNIEFDY